MTADEASLEDIAPFYGAPSQEGLESLPQLSPACQVSEFTEREEMTRQNPFTIKER